MITKTRILLLLLLSVFVIRADEISSNYDDIKTQSMEKEEMYEVYEVPVLKTRDLEETKLFHGNNSFFIRDKNNVKKVHPCWIDKEIRSISKERLGKMLECGYLSLKKMSDGEFKVQAHVRGEGGGAVGATAGAIFGKFLVHFIGHGAIQIVAVCTGPAYLVTLASLEAALLPTVIEPLSNVAAVGFGIAGAVATGPV